MKLFFDILLIILLILGLIVSYFTFIKVNKYHCNKCKYTTFNVFRRYCKYCGERLFYHDNERKKIAEEYWLIMPENAANGVSEYCDKCNIVDSFDFYLCGILLKLKRGQYEEIQKSIEEILDDHGCERSTLSKPSDEEIDENEDNADNW